jgi:hypothetical protein
MTTRIGLESAIDLVASNLRNDEFLILFTDMLNYAVEEYAEEFADVRFKFQDPTQLREIAIKEIITELGFDYIRNLMDTLDDISFNVLIDFLSLLNLLKGSRRGLEIVLQLLGLDSIIVEWWENQPQKEPMTFDLTIIVTNSTVPDIEDTLSKIRIFVQHYVIPKLNLIEFQFILGAFLEQSAGIAGFVRLKEFGRIVGKI